MHRFLRRITRDGIAKLLELAGAGLIALGAGLIYLPAGVIIGGIGMLAWALLLFDIEE